MPQGVRHNHLVSVPSFIAMDEEYSWTLTSSSGLIGSFSCTWYHNRIIRLLSATTDASAVAHLTPQLRLQVNSSPNLEGGARRFRRHPSLNAKTQPWFAARSTPTTGSAQPLQRLLSIHNLKFPELSPFRDSKASAKAHAFHYASL
jgi:hypothetical protein